LSSTRYAKLAAKACILDRLSFGLSPVVTVFDAGPRASGFYYFSAIDQCLESYVLSVMGNEWSVSRAVLFPWKFYLLL